MLECFCSQMYVLWLWWYISTSFAVSTRRSVMTCWRVMMSEWYSTLCVTWATKQQLGWCCIDWQVGVSVWTSGYHVPALIIVSGRSTGLMSEPLMAPPQLKPSPPLLHKEPPILIKQASLDKNKGGKKDKVWKDLHFFVPLPMLWSFTLYVIC